MTNDRAEYRLSTLFLLIYAGVSAIGVYVAYRLGLLVEGSFGAETSLIFFLVAFMAALITAFPIAMAVASRRERAS